MGISVLWSRGLLQESARNPKREMTVESHPSKNEGRAPASSSSPFEPVHGNDALKPAGSLITNPVGFTYHTLREYAQDRFGAVISISCQVRL